MGTTILRFEKHKSMANIRSAGAHQYRHHADTPNADASLKSKNVRLVGTNNLGADVAARLEALDKLPRKNSVLAMDGLVTLSPELLEDKTNLNNWANKTRDWLKNEFGDNLVNCVIHLDESSPHAHFTVVCCQRNADGKMRLNARDMFNKFTLSNLQKKYFEEMRKYIPDLESPRHGAKRKHTELKEFYAQLDEIKEELKVAGQEMFNEIKEECRDTLLNKYTPMVDKAIARLAGELDGRLTDEIKQKLEKEFKDALQNQIENSFESSKTLDKAQEKLNEKIERSKLELTNKTLKKTNKFKR